MDDRIVLSDGRSSVTLYPPITYPGGHGFEQRVDLVGGPFLGSLEISTYLSLPAWEQFRKDLKRLHQSLKGDVNTDGWFPNFRLALMGDGRGHVLVMADATDERAQASSLSFSFLIDQTYLPPVIATLAQWGQGVL